MQTATHQESSIRFGAFELNLQTRELYRNGSRLKVRGHPVEVLAILLEHPGELVTREMLRKRLWPDDTFVDFEQILNNSVGKLREALGDNSDSPTYIETLPRMGYRFVAQVEDLGADDDIRSAAIAAQLPALLDGIDSPHGRSKRWILWSGLALVSGLIAFAYWYVHLPLPAPRITDYKILTLDGRLKNIAGTDGTRLYLNLMMPQSNAQVPVTGGKLTEIPIELPVGTGSPSWLGEVSPDTANILVFNGFTREEGYMLWVMGTLGHPAHYLTRAYAAAWSPDGKSVVYTTPHGDGYVIGSEGGQSRLLFRADTPSNEIVRGFNISWSPDGKIIRLTRWGSAIFEVTETGSNFHEWLPGWNGGVRKCCGRWTPDGQFYIFLAGNSLGKGPVVWPLAQVWVVDERRGKIRPTIPEPILLTPGPLLWGYPVPSRDGRWVFARGVSLRGELERYDPQTRSLTPYLDGISAEMLDFSHDGKYVAYVSFPDGLLWRANRDGTGALQLSKPPFYPRNPHWSPDGTQILFTDNTESGVDLMYTVSSKGGTPQRVQPDDNGPQSLAVWSPDGKRVVYTAHPGFSFVPWDASRIKTRILELATGRTTTLPDRPGGFWSVHWSPDGNYLSGLSFRTNEMVIFDLDKQRWRSLVVTNRDGTLGFNHWSHDGKFIYFIELGGNDFGLYRVPVEGGKPELVFNIPKAFRSTGWYSRWVSLDPDDAPLLLRDAGTDEIYALALERK